MKIWVRIVIAVVLVALCVAAWVYYSSVPEMAEPGDVSVSEETRRLDAGEVLLTRLEPAGGVGAAAQAKGVIEAPVSKVWPAVRDCQHFDKFMPRVMRSELREDRGDELLCFVLVDMPWPADDLEAETLSKIERLPDNTFRRSWHLVRGSFEHNTGSYEVAPFQGDPDRSLVTYIIDANPNVPLPDAVLKQAQAKTLPELFEKIAEHVGAR